MWEVKNLRLDKGNMCGEKKSVRLDEEKLRTWAEILPMDDWAHRFHSISSSTSPRHSIFVCNKITLQCHRSVAPERYERRTKPLTTPPSSSQSAAA